MSDISAFLRSSHVWLSLKEELETGTFPSAMALCLPQGLHSGLILELAKIGLCLNRCGCGTCRSCLAWNDGSHPDLLFASVEGPPSVDDCRAMIAELSLKPVVSDGRLGVIPWADKLNLNSSNSLLKITEEPPDGCRLIFLMEENRLIPTLRSRVWTVCFPEDDVFPPLEPPSGKSQWLEWLERTASSDRDQLTTELNRFVVYLVKEKRYNEASGLSQLIFLANQTNLSLSMMGDMVFLIIEEDYPFESVFDSIW